MISIIITNLFILVSWRKISTNKRKHKSKSFVVVPWPNLYSRSHGCLANATSKEFLRGKETCVISKLFYWHSFKYLLPQKVLLLKTQLMFLNIIISLCDEMILKFASCRWYSQKTLLFDVKTRWAIAKLIYLRFHCLHFNYQIIVKVQVKH